MTKHEQLYIQMIDENKAIFDDFMEVHDKYSKDQKLWQIKFNEIGEKIIAVIRDRERQLCSKTERGQFGKFSANLSEKFWNLVRKDFPKIDFVGVKP